VAKAEQDTLINDDNLLKPLHLKDSKSAMESLKSTARSSRLKKGQAQPPRQLSTATQGLSQWLQLFVF
ncbi:MAG: hypothetical protein ACI4VD_07225, partial [Limosilactobacillus mucosae]